MKKTQAESILRLAMPTRHFLIAAVWLAALNAPAQSPMADAFNPGANNSVYCLAVQPDGKILAGGSFSTLGGQTRTNLARLNADGSLDTNFNASVASYYGSVGCLGMQPDGKILVGGPFTSLGGQACTNFGRLNADGSLDAAFNPKVMPEGVGVASLAMQSDGKLVLGGYFNWLGGLSRNYIGRLNANGSVDTSFNPGAANGVFTLTLQPDGKILAGGDFLQLGGQARANLGRLNANGSVDTTFNPGANDLITCLAVQADGKILVAGYFTVLGGQTCTNFGRLNADGSRDATFNPGVDNTIRYLAVQADGKILAGGWFTKLGGQARTNLGRLNADGSLDAAFNPEVGGPGSYVDELALQADGKIVVGGNFTRLGGQSRTNLGRLNATEAATQSLAFNGSAITWLRGGTSPEVWRTTFEICTNGVDWINPGAGTRITGGWQRTGLNYPTNAIIRARGFVCGANWFVETVQTPNLPLQFINGNGTPSVSNGWFNTRLTGTTGDRAVAEWSPDLATWQPWLTNTLPASGWNLSLPVGTNSRQFLRARLTTP
jgi:uncharacterized delta-60 repeat protein